MSDSASRGPIASLVAAATLAAVSTLFSTTVVAQAPAFVVAVVEEDRLRPVASFGAAGWAAWPAGATSGTLSGTLSRTLPELWTTVVPGGAPRSVRVVAASSASAAGAASVGGCAVLGDLGTKNVPARRAPLPGSADVETLGVAVSGSAPVVAVSAVDVASAPRLVLAAIERVFSAREQEQRLSVANLATFPVQVMHLFSTPPAAGGEVFYFEAVKRVPDPRRDADIDVDDDPKGTLTITVSGWLRANRADVAPIATKAEVGWAQDVGRSPRSASASDRSAAAAPALRPLGVVLAGGASVWLMREATATGGRVVLYDVGASAAGRLLAMDPARCQ